MAKVIGAKKEKTVGLEVPAKNGETLKHGEKVKHPNVTIDVKANDGKKDKKDK